MKVKVGIGQDSHRIDEINQAGKKLVLAGVVFDASFCLEGNSDADVVLHALTNAFSGITAIPVLGPVSDKLCGEGIRNSEEYLKVALKDLADLSYSISHVSIALECLKPKILPKLKEMRENIARILKIDLADVALTATSGEGLTDFGRGMGIQVFSTVTAVQNSKP